METIIANKPFFVLDFRPIPFSLLIFLSSRKFVYYFLLIITIIFFLPFANTVIFQLNSLPRQGTLNDRIFTCD